VTPTFSGLSRAASISVFFCFVTYILPTDFKNDRYLCPGTRYLTTVSNGRASAQFEDTHWNLEAMSRQLFPHQLRHPPTL
jgi:hypothetical protein